MQENMICPKIIAINPGWRYLAVAIFDECELSEWRLKCLSGKDAKMKLKKVIDILGGFSARYNPEILVIKTLHPARSSANLKNMAAGIEAYCRKRGMAVISYSIQELESVLLNSSRVHKKELLKIIASEYPELSPELRREARNRNSYFLRLFEAVALGHVCLSAINNKH
jgi:hypothetical protein